MLTVDLKNVVKLKHCFLCMSEMWVVLEFMEGGTLTEAVRASRFRENEVAYVAHEMFAGLSFMHENQVIHRDLVSPSPRACVPPLLTLLRRSRPT